MPIPVVRKLNILLVKVVSRELGHINVLSENTTRLPKKYQRCTEPNLKIYSVVSLFENINICPLHNIILCWVLKINKMYFNHSCFSVWLCEHNYNNLIIIAIMFFIVQSRADIIKYNKLCTQINLKELY